MFKVATNRFDDDLAFDPARQSDLAALAALVALIRADAPSLPPYFHAWTWADQPGMRFKAAALFAIDPRNPAFRS